MYQILCVGAGGCLGAILRYLLGLLPYQGEFPLITFGINFVGAVFIGIIAEVAFAKVDNINTNLVLFLKVGFCGGFTTLSSLGLETMVLFDKGKYLLGGGYAVSSMVFCLVGVALGRIIAKSLLGTNISA